MTVEKENFPSFPLVTVLISTFNGEKYIAQQLDSLIHQSYPNLEIIIRDDGSSDGTKNILLKYQSEYSNIFFYCGDNIGVTASFFDLLTRASSDGYYAFCDQDDIWLPEKINRGISMLETSTIPSKSVYFSRLALVDEQLNPFGESSIPNCLCFENALVENVITGATAIFGSDVRNMVLNAKSEYMIWHDWWLYLLGSSLGHLVYDESITLLSRRHHQNQTLMRNDNSENFLAKLTLLKRVLRRRRKVDIFMQAHYFYKTYHSQLDHRYIKPLLMMSDIFNNPSIKNKARFVFNRSIRMNKCLDTLAIKLLVLFGQKP